MMLKLSFGTWIFLIGLTLLIAGKACVAQAGDVSDLKGAEYDSKDFRSYLESLPRIEGLQGQGFEPYYIVDGDLRLTGRQIWARVNEEPSLPKSSNNELNVMFRGNAREIWPPQERKLTYAIDRRSFGSEQKYREVRNNLKLAASAWTEGCDCGLSISHIDRFDRNPSLDNVTFIVKFSPSGRRYYAAAFFPGDPKETRFLLIGPSYFKNPEYDPVGVLRHEFGHILGYRHSHIGGVDPRCMSVEEFDAKWVTVGTYNRKSVMHYLCGEGGTATLELTIQDREEHWGIYRNQF